MKRIWLLFFCFFVIGFYSFSVNLNGTTWGPEKEGHGYYLKFKTEKDFEFLYNGEGGGQSVLGTYLQNGDKIELNTVTINDWGELPAYIKQKTINCSIIEANSLFSQYKIVGSNGMELWSITHKPKNGEPRNLDGNSVYVFQTKGKINDNARLREGPGLQYKYYVFSLEDEPEEYGALPKSYGVKIFGYSEKTTVVDGIDMPWYYCSFRKNMWEDQFGWIWGGLIDF